VTGLECSALTGVGYNTTPTIVAGALRVGKRIFGTLAHGSSNLIDCLTYHHVGFR